MIGPGSDKNRKNCECFPYVNLTEGIHGTHQCQVQQNCLSVGSSSAFQLVSEAGTVESLTVGQDLRLSCQADDDYEYCWWRHQGDTGGEQRECSLEWKYSQVTLTSHTLKDEGLRSLICLF